MNTTRPEFVRPDPMATVAPSNTRVQADLAHHRREAGSPTVTHIRMGRGMVAVKRYENEGSIKKRSSKPLLTRSSPSSPVETAPGQEPKRKWYSPSLLKRKRNVSLSGVGGPQDIKSWADGVRTEEPWDEATRSEAGPSLSTITSSDDLSSSQGSSYIRHSLPLPTHQSTSSSVCSRSTSSSARPNELPGSHKPTSPITHSIYEEEEDEDENGRILLEALGLAEPATSPQLTEQPTNWHTHHEDTPEPEEQPEVVPEEPEPEHEGYEDPEPEEEPPTPTPTRFRPLPIPPQFRPHVQPQPHVSPETLNNQFLHVPPPHDSQDAFAYVFGPTPRSSVYADHREPDAPPPPYASRQSAILDRHRSRPRPEDLYLLQQQLNGLILPEVPPLSIRRREEKQGQRRGW